MVRVISLVLMLVGCAGIQTKEVSDEAEAEA